MIMRVASLVALVAIAIAAPACHSHDDAAAPAVVPGAPAGDVTEVAGDVHATRDGKTRALAKGDVVSGDDLIATGADGRVTIVLRHNQVAWSLGPGKAKKLADSAAWAAAKGASGEAISDDHSSAAGRHAERMAADTSATSAGSSAAGSGSDAARADERAAAQDEAARKQAEEQLEALQKEKEALDQRAAADVRAKAADEKLAKPRGGGGGGGAAKGKQACQCVAGDPLCACLDDGVLAPKGDIDGGDAQVEGSLDRTVIQRVFRQHASDFTRCYQKLLATKPGAAGKVRLRLTIGADGKVTHADVDGDAALAPSYDCLEAAARALRFPASRGTIAITYPLSFAAAP
jgi:hypothetical protein